MRKSKCEKHCWHQNFRLMFWGERMCCKCGLEQRSVLVKVPREGHGKYVWSEERRWVDIKKFLCFRL